MRLDVHNHVIPHDVIRLVSSDSAFGIDISDGWRGPDREEGDGRADGWHDRS